MDFAIGCSLAYSVNAPAALVFNLEAATHLSRQIIRSESLSVHPPLEPERFTAPETGNRFARFVVSPGSFRLDYRAEVTLDPLVQDPAAVGEFQAQDLPMTTLPHLYASRYCQSDQLLRFANRQFGREPSGYLRVTAICNWIYSNVDYISGSTDALTSAFDTVTQRAGVCRDFAHLGIALCRALGIPARYVSAYAWRLVPPDFHAVFEAYLSGPDGGGWYLFDPTRMTGADGLVRIGIGRDAADVAFCSIFGDVTSGPPQVWIDGPDTTRPVTTAAVSLQASE
jgi:transglutaminase-like putative cysteine protease